MSNLAPELRQRARELRALADEIADPRITERLRRAAAACERFAHSEERHGSDRTGDVLPPMRSD